MLGVKQAAECMVFSWQLGLDHDKKGFLFTCRNKVKVSTAHFQEDCEKIYFFSPGLLSLHFAAQMLLGPIYLSSVNCFHSSPKVKSSIPAVNFLKFKPISDFMEI